MLCKLALAVAAALVAAPALSQESSTPAPAPVKPKKKPKKKAKEPEEPKDLGPVAESTKIEPYLTYRTGSLKPVEESVYHKKEHGDFADQIYLTLRFARTYDYVHEVVIEPSLRTIRNNPGSWDDPVVEQAYIESQAVSHVSLTAGKKAEFEGSGFIVNPSDLLNEKKDVFDPLYQKEGVVFTRVRYRADDWGVGVGFIPKRGQAAKEGKAWLTASADVLETDLRLQATANAAEKTTVGLSAARFFGGSFELHADGRHQTRQFDPDEFDELKYSAYTGENLETRSDDSPSGNYLGGTRFIFTPRRTFVAEYITNQSGLLPEDFERRFAELREDKEKFDKVKEPPTRLLGRHYAFASYQDDDTLPATHLALSWLMNTDDKSVFATASVRYALSPITSVELAPTLFRGGTDTEFGEMPFAQATYLVFRGRF